MRLTWSKLVPIVAVLLAAAFVLLMCRTRAPGLGPAADLCAPVQCPELRPSAGLAWSKRHYAEQYAGERRTGILTGLDDRENERFLDVAGRAYSREFVSNFSYTDPERQPRVTVEYLLRAETFVGKLTARGLKPNFAYQLKLRGVLADPVSFDRIGYVGRWRLPGRKTNYPDDKYEASPDKDQAESYLLFDFFVTDGEGNAEKEFYADCTLHVLFNATHQSGPGPTDSPVVPAVRVDPEGTLYSNPYAEDGPQMIYAQSEQHALGRENRPGIGEAFLAPGYYVAELVLTEESFHSYGDGGYWATVMSGAVEFDVVARPRPTRRWMTHAMVFPLSLASAQTRDMEVRTVDSSRLWGTPSGKRPRILFTEALDLPAEHRHLLSLEVCAAETYACEIRVDDGGGFDAGARYPIRSTGCTGWRRFDVEITGAVSGRPAFLRLDLPDDLPGVAVRNVAIHRIMED